MTITVRTMLVAAAVVAFASAPAMAFHDEGVARCNGCHTMHNSEDNLAMNYTAGGVLGGTAPGTGYQDLLLYANKSDVCLRCHGSATSGYSVWAASYTGGYNEHGAGNFVYQTAPDIMDDTRAASVPGRGAGHTIASLLKGTTADPVLTLAPGGDYPATDLYCTSCHDPHGTDSFRMLYRAGQTTESDSGLVIDWDVDLVAADIGVSASQPETDTRHNAYQSGYSEWCAKCHGDFHAASGNLIHPSGEPMEQRQIDVYNSYLGTTNCIDNPPTVGNPCGTGSAATAYKAAVPFEDAANTSTSSTAGPTATSRVACVSCHRAHGSSAPNGGRWDFNVRLLAEDGVHTGTYAIPNPYPTDAIQKSMCNKCHSQDEFDAAE
jgi:predicted CXXCH cytochrome family protein